MLPPLLRDDAGPRARAGAGGRRVGRRAAGRRGRGRAAARRPRGDEDGDLGRRAVRRHACARSSSSRTSRSAPATPLVVDRPRAAADGRPAASGACTSTRWRARRRATRPALGRPSRSCAGWSSASTSRPRACREAPRRARLDGSGDEAFARAASDVLDIFADVCSLFRRQARPTRTGRTGTASGRGVPLHLPARARRRRAPACPPALPRQAAARPRPLRRRGASTRTPELEESAALDLQGAPARGASRSTPVLALLERGSCDEASRARRGGRRTLPRAPRPPRRGHRRAATRRSATSRARCATGSSTSPLLRARARRRSTPRPSAILARLVGAAPDAPERAARIAALVECPQPLAGLLARTASSPAPAAAPRRRCSRCCTRRYYRIRRARGRPPRVAGRPRRRGWRVRASRAAATTSLSTHALEADLASALRDVAGAPRRPGPPGARRRGRRLLLAARRAGDADGERRRGAGRRSTRSALARAPGRRGIAVAGAGAAWAACSTSPSAPARRAASRRTGSTAAPTR